MVRAPYYDKNGMKKGAWSAEEDHKLRSYVERYGHWNWRKIPKFAGLERCGKSCRLRWMNSLQPQLKRGKFTEEENALIIKIQQEIGNRWSTIASKLPGRTDNQIKNQWNAHLKKLAKPNLFDSILETSYKLSPPLSSGSDSEPITGINVGGVVTDDICLPSSFTSDSGSITDFDIDVVDGVCLPSSFTSDSGSITDFDIDVVDDVCLPWSPTLYEVVPIGGDFWSEPFVEDNIYYNQVGYPGNIFQ